MHIAEGTFAGLAPTEIELFQRALRNTEGVGVEIGCLDGWSTAHILECSKLHLTVIDPFVPDSMAPNLCGSVDRFWENVDPWKDRVRLIRDYSQNIGPTWTQPLDFLFIDGDHHYPSVLADFEQWARHVKRGGILAMHDSRMYRYQDVDRALFHPGPSVVAMSEVYEKPLHWRILGEVFSLTVAVRTKNE
jgi:hypothetical protein